jgi:hypothetical protein
MLKRSYRVKFLNEGHDRSSPLHKHVRLYEDKDTIPEPKYRNSICVHNVEELERLFKQIPQIYLVVSKDPYSWFLSYKNWASNCGWPQADHHYIEEYNLFYGKLLELANDSDKFVFIRYAELVESPEQMIKDLAEKLNLNERFFGKYLRLSPSRVKHSRRFTEKRKRYYLSKEYLHQLSVTTIEDINNRLDTAVLAGLGYQILEPPNTESSANSH